MGKRGNGNFIHVVVDDDDDEEEEEYEDSDDVHEATLSDRLWLDYSKHRSCWRHLAASFHGVRGKQCIIDMKEMQERDQRFLPCLSDSRYCRKRSKRKVTGLAAEQRWKMGDSVFHSHLENIWNSYSEDKKSSFAHLDCLCFWLYKKKGIQALNPTKRKNIFSKKYVFVPIVCWDHWRLLVLCNFGEAANSKVRTRCILLLDSIELGAQQIGPDVRKFVYDIFKAEGRPESRDVIYRIPLLVPKVPQQTNDVDCGRFVLYFIRKFMDAAPKNFSILNGYPYFLKEDWFDLKSFGKFCDKLEKEMPTQKQEVCVSRRVSQRIRNAKRTIPRKSSPQVRKIIMVED